MHQNSTICNAMAGIVEGRKTRVRLEIGRLVSTHLLFDLQLVHHGSKLRQNLVCLLMIFELCGDEVGEVAEGFGSVEDLRSVSLILPYFCILQDNKRLNAHSS